VFPEPEIVLIDCVNSCGGSHLHCISQQQTALIALRRHMKHYLSVFASLAAVSLFSGCDSLRTQPTAFEKKSPHVKRAPRSRLFGTAAPL